MHFTSDWPAVMFVALNIAVPESSSLSTTEPVAQLLALFAVEPVNAAFEYRMITIETPHAVTSTANTTATTIPRLGFVPCSHMATPSLAREAAPIWPLRFHEREMEVLN